MNDEQLKRMLSDAFPSTPAVFHRRLTDTAEKIRARGRQRTRRIIARGFMFALLGALLLTGALAVADRLGVLNFSGDSWYDTLPQARSMVRTNLAMTRTGALVWRVEEAVYDGRVLRILYSMTDTTVTTPWTQAEKQDSAETAGSYSYQARVREDVTLACDGNGSISVDGISVNLRSVMQRLGDAPGKIEYWVDSALEYYDSETDDYVAYHPGDTLSIEMDFARMSDFSDRSALPPPLSFTLDSKNAAAQYEVTLPDDVTLRDGEKLHFTDAHFSPASIVLRYTVTIPRASLPEDFPMENDQDQIFDWEMAQMESGSEFVDVAGKYLADTLLNARGEQMGRSRDCWSGSRTLDAEGNLTVTIYYEGTPDERLTPVNYLVVNSQRVAIPLEYAHPAS